MLTLREFITKIAKYQHFGVYMDNRDGLVYESYKTKHCVPYACDWSRTDENISDEPESYCNNQYEAILDDETKRFLELYGNYEVFRIESETTIPPKNSFYSTINILNIFIIPPKFGKDVEPCSRCDRSVFVADENEYRGYREIPDVCDHRCNNCIYGPNKLIHYIDNFDIYHILQDGEEVLKITPDRTLNQITLETNKEVYSGPIDLIRFKEDIK